MDKMWTAEQILQTLAENRSLLQQWGVQHIGLFGSFGRGEATPQSDIDLLFSMDKINFARWMDLWNWLEEKFERKVDLVPESELRPEIRSRVLAEVRYVEIN